MFTHTIQWWRENQGTSRWLVVLGLVLLSFFPIYRNIYYGLGKEQLKRHEQFMKGESLYFNPWQYRVLCPWIVEAGYQLLSVTIKPVIEKVTVGKKYQADALLYFAVFIAFRFLLHALIFILAFEFYKKWLNNNRLIFFGFLWLTYSMGNAVRSSDLSFNTYMDVILYLFALLVWVKGKSPWWLVFIMILGGLNRETSLLIPILFFFDPNEPSLKLRWHNILPIGVACSFFVAIFIGIRWHYGYQSPTVYYVPAGFSMLKLNLLSGMARYSYMEVLGTVSLLPLIILYYWRETPDLLKKLFVWMIPIWFGIHYWSVVAWESRLFLVPVVIVLLPAVLSLIEKSSTIRTTYDK